MENELRISINGVEFAAMQTKKKTFSLEFLELGSEVTFANVETGDTVTLSFNKIESKDEVSV